VPDAERCRKASREGTSKGVRSQRREISPGSTYLYLAQADAGREHLESDAYQNAYHEFRIPCASKNTNSTEFTQKGDISVKVRTRENR